MKSIKIILIFICTILINSQYALGETNQQNFLFGLAYEKDSAYIFSLISQFEADHENGAISNRELAVNYLRLSEFFHESGQFEDATQFLEKSRKVMKASPDSLMYFQAATVEARLMMNEGNRAEAQVLLLEALSFFSKAVDSVCMATTLRLIGNNYDYLSEHDVALDYYLQAKRICEAKQLYVLLARVCRNMAGLYGEINEYKKSIAEFNQAIKYAILSQDTYALHGAYHGLSIVYKEMGEINMSMINLHKSVQVAGDELHLGFSYQSYGLLYSTLENYDSAEYYLVKTLQIGRKYKNSQLTGNALEELVNIFYLTNRYKEAFDFQKKYREHRDSIYNQKNSAILETIRAQYLNEKNERELLEKNLKLEVTEAELREQVITKWALIAIICLLSLSVFLIYRVYKSRNRVANLLKEKNLEIEAQKQRIQQANEAKSRWLVNFAHEFKTPLTLIIGPVSRSLSVHQDMDEEVRHDLILVEKNARKLSGLVNEILELSKLEEGGVELDKSVVDLTGLVRSAVESNQSLAGIKEVKLTIGQLPSLSIEADSMKLSKVLSNLISNAVKFTSAGGEITVNLSLTEEIRLAVSDSGFGIPSRDLPFVFDRFYQSVSQSVRPSGGTGIGLSLSKEIALLHGGDILVESELGKGSTFIVVLPKDLITEMRVDEEERPSEHDHEEKRVISLVDFKKKPELLLVEDNPDMMSYVQSLLQPYFKIHTAGNGIGAIEILGQRKIDFIISDVMMPVMDGIDFSRKVKSSLEWRWIPFIHLSAITSDFDRKESLRIGVDDFLHKPFDPDELLIRVSNLYSNSIYRLEKELPGDEPSFDEKILKKLRDEVNHHISDTHYNVYRLAESAAMSERQIYRFLKQATGLTPLQFIQEVKLTRAMELAQKRIYTNTGELARAVGFLHGSYFTGLFTKRFGKRPADYLRV